MSEIDKIKKEARELLDEVNNKFEKPPFSNSEYTTECSFRDRLQQLKEKVTSLQTSSASLATSLGKTFY